MISPLERIERLIAGAVEGAAARWFPGTAPRDAPALHDEPAVDCVPGPATLSVARGAGTQAHVEVGSSEVCIGRAADNDLVLPDQAVSRHHALVLRRGDTFVVVDLASTNGTHVNGRGVSETGLQHGDCLRLGATEVVFRVRRA